LEGDSFMARAEQVGTVNDRTGFHAVVLFVTLFLLLTGSTLAQSQSFQVLYSFTNTGDGYCPIAGLTLDGGGKLYGSTTNATGPGALFQLQRAGSGWVLNNLHTFHTTDGSTPQANMTFGPDGSLYGTTPYGGAFGFGTVYNLRPPTTVCRTGQCPWTERVLYSFQGGADGGTPWLVEPVFDLTGNLYGTTYSGGAISPAGGVIFRLSRLGGAWTESVIHSFGGSDHPYSGVVFDPAGNLYGSTTNGGGYAVGYVFQLALPSGGFNDLHDFRGIDGGVPIGALITDASGKVYGTTSGGGPSGGGTVFELSPGSPWSFALLKSLAGGTLGNLAMDADGNLYGTTYQGGAYGYGSVFQLAPAAGGWIYTTLHDFTDGDDGGIPMSGPILDRDGNLYGTTTTGGRTGGNCPEFGCGVVWEVAK
jgi:uncharacterized repeat protein (TIGR03803 family)